MRSVRWTTCLVLLAACGPGGGSSAGSSTTGTSGATSTSSTSGTSTTTPTSSETSADPVTTSATGGTSTTTTGASTTAPVDPSTTTTSETTAADTGSAAGSTSGGPVGACEAVTGNYGPCDALIGHAFKDGTCQLISGCSCEPDCDLFFEDAVACAKACAAAGECNEAAIKGAGIAAPEVGPGSFCDEVDACVDLPELKVLFPELTCDAGIPCGGTNCHLLFSGELTPALWQQICAASLLPGVGELFCVVFGP